MLIWYKIMHKFSYEHNIQHNRSQLRALHPNLIRKIYLHPNCANLVIKNNKIIYKLWHNCSSHGHNVEIPMYSLKFMCSNLLEILT